MLPALFLHQRKKGPLPMQLVVVMAVTKAVSAATMTFTTISMMCFFLSFISLGFKDFRFGISDLGFQISDLTSSNASHFRFLARRILRIL